MGLAVYSAVRGHNDAQPEFCLAHKSMGTGRTANLGCCLPLCNATLSFVLLKATIQVGHRMRKSLLRTIHSNVEHIDNGA
jgi:hypothetical protein